MHGSVKGIPHADNGTGATLKNISPLSEPIRVAFSQFLIDGEVGPAGIKPIRLHPELLFYLPYAAERHVSAGAVHRCFTFNGKVKGDLPNLRPKQPLCLLSPGSEPQEWEVKNQADTQGDNRWPWEDHDHTGRN